MTPEQIEQLRKLLEETEVKEVEQGQRVYTSSSVYGISRYHLIDRDYYATHIEQIETGEKWSKRVTLYGDETKVLLACLIKWYFEDIEKKQKENDALGDLDDHPF